MKTTQKQRRQLRVRNRIRRLAQKRPQAARPRLSVYRSGKHIYAQVIVYTDGRTVAAASTVDRELKGDLKSGATTDAARKVGELVAKRAIEAGVSAVVFDRGAYPYHGRVKELAEGAREGGLAF